MDFSCQLSYTLPSSMNYVFSVELYDYLLCSSTGRRGNYQGSGKHSGLNTKPAAIRHNSIFPLEA